MANKVKVDTVCFVNDFTSESVLCNSEDQDKLNPNFELILDRLGFDPGYYQICIFIVVGVIGMCDAGEAQALSLVLPILEKEWGISSFQESLMGSLVFAGYLIGSLASGFFGDNYGRKNCILYSSVFMLVISLAGACMPNYILYTLFRILLVTCIGFIIPIAFSLLAENTPLKHRGFVLVFIGFFYTLGELTVCVLAYIFMPTLESGNWRAVLVWSSIPAFIVVFISYFVLLESPRFLLVKGKPELARDIILRMGRMNKVDMNELKKYSIGYFNTLSDQLTIQAQQLDEKGEICAYSYKSQINSLFTHQFRRITLIVWYQWMASSFVFAGIQFLLPLTLKKYNPDEDSGETQDLNAVTLSVLGELPALLIATVVVNIRYLGRKNSLAIAYFLSGVLCSIIFFDQQSKTVFTFLVAGSKLSINLAFTINYEFTAEIYPTYMRASGIGLASCVGKIGSIVMPWVVIYGTPNNIFIPYLIFGSISIMGGLLTLFLPFDTYKRELDKPNS